MYLKTSFSLISCNRDGGVADEPITQHAKLSCCLQCKIMRPLGPPKNNIPPQAYPYSYTCTESPGKHFGFYNRFKNRCT